VAALARADESERHSLACLSTRAPRPLSCPWSLDRDAELRILAARRRANYGPARLAGLVGRHRSTVWKVLRRNGCSRRRRSEPRQTTRRYEWAEPGALLHIDAMQLPKFDRPGHWATGRGRHRSRGAGKVYVVSMLDDRSRLAYSELHSAETAATASATLERAVSWLREQGCGPPQAVMSDNHKAYTSHRFKGLLASLGARHIPTPAYTPRWNGKLERFNQTLSVEWARSRIWPHSLTRDKALSSFLRYYNRRRPHTSLGDRPPISRVQQVCGQDS